MKFGADINEIETKEKERKKEKQRKKREKMKTEKINERRSWFFEKNQ